jgi:hypothetical protein
MKKELARVAALLSSEGSVMERSADEVARLLPDVVGEAVVVEGKA